MLILSGAEDRWTPAALCGELVDKLHPEHDTSLQVFDGAYHLFDHPGIDMTELGYVIRSDPEAAAEAARLARAFLAQRL